MTEPGDRKLDEEVERLLGEAGPFANSKRFRVRSGQVAMAGAVARTLMNDSILLCEAGTGTGKTLGYLLPAILSGQRVILSTATKALEDQILEREVPLVEQVLGIKASIHVAKGLSNYLCRRRLGELEAAVMRQQPTTREVRRALPMIRDWVTSTRTGDRAEMGELSEEDPIWSQVLATRESRIGAGCTYFDDCFVTRLKEELAQARIVIVNHHLFFADLALKSRAGPAGFQRAGVLPPYDAVIFDEAHRNEDVASLFFGARVNSSRLLVLARDTRAAWVAEGMPGANALLEDLQLCHQAFVDVTRRYCPDEGKTLLEAEVREGPFLRAIESLVDAVIALENFLESNAVSSRLDALVRCTSELRNDLEELCAPRSGSVVYAERSADEVSVSTRAVDVGPILAEQLHRRSGALVFASATLRTSAAASAGSEFAFFRARVGVSDVKDVPVEEIAIPSPFDFDRQTLLYVPRDLPPVQTAEFADAAIERTAELILASGGGALVLTTSVRMMATLGRGLARGQRRPVLVQGDAPKAVLLEEFRSRQDGILVATMGFWEGVDIPGRALRLVVIDRLPFAVPNDAMVQARSRLLEQEGHDPFSGYAVPEALITLKQGVGRLIRTETDFGVVAVLDRRLIEKGYGKRMLRNLPMQRLTHDLAAVQAFFQARADEAAQS